MKELIRSWFGQESPGRVEPWVPEGQRVYCIGDIHGRLDLLEEIHRKIVADAHDFNGEKTLIYLGDYIDRGDHSKQVIDLLINRPLPGFEHVFLLGNHEQTLLDFLEHPHEVAAWLTYGGRATLHSYGVASHGSSREDLVRLRDEFQQRLPEAHLDFFQEMQLTHVVGTYCFVHAGIRPEVVIDEQRKEDLLWIRDDFINSAVQHDHVVVHGHSITTEVDWQENRIGIDTGAFHTGVLTCLVLEGSEQRLLQTDSGAA